MNNYIDFISGRKTSDVFGVSRYANELERHVTGFKFHRIDYPNLTHNHFLDGTVRQFIYPFIVKSKIKKGTVKHISTQYLASILNYIPTNQSIVTCHDLIPWCYEKNRSIQWKLNIKGLKKSSVIITISQFSKKEILNELHFSEDNIYVIPLGVDHATFFPYKERKILRDKFKILNEWPIILYVGSEEPRKNLRNLIQALSIIKSDFPQFKFIKAGESQFGGQRRELESLIISLNLKENVIFTGKVAEMDLPSLYNLADVFVFPSFYEGFGFPPLEAMACGCPVVVSGCTSIPEVVGNAGEYIDPCNPQSIAQAIINVLNDREYRKDMIQKGILQAQKFIWENTAKQTEKVYKDVWDL